MRRRASGDRMTSVVGRVAGPGAAAVVRLDGERDVAAQHLVDQRCQSHRTTPNMLGCAEKATAQVRAQTFSVRSPSPRAPWVTPGGRAGSRPGGRRASAPPVPARACPGCRRPRRAPSSTSGGRNASAMPALERRRQVAARHHADALAVDQDRAVGPRRAAALDLEAPQPAGRRPARARPARRRVAPEVALAPGHHPAQAGLQRRDAGAQLVAVQRQAGLEPQRVAGAEPGGRHARGRRRRPTPRRRAAAGTASSTPSSPV